MGWQRLQDPQLQQRLQMRAKILAKVREFFIREGFLEVETPILVPTAGQEPHLNPMKVEFTAPPPQSSPIKGEEEKRSSPPLAGGVRGGGDQRSIHGHLITSPEYAHKKLLAAGFEKTFEITRAFRAGEHWGGLHNPEFTILEWYRANADYTKIMDDVEKMVQYVWNGVIASPRIRAELGVGFHSAKQSDTKCHPRLDPRFHGDGSMDSRFRGNDNRKIATASGLAMTLIYKNHAVDLSSPWQRLTVAEVFEKYAGMPKEKRAYLCDRTFLRAWCRDNGYAVSESDTYEDLFYKIFLTEIEPKLGYPKPTILYEWPAQMAALAKFKDSSPPPQSSPIKGEEERGNSPPLVGGVRGGGRNASKVAERFELYIAGMELANAFSELTDAKEQRRRFMAEQKLRKKLGKEIIPLDEDFLDAVGHLSPCAGIALGVDRLVMLLTNAKTIGEVLTFPASQLF